MAAGKSCFGNAATLALEDRGTYVEGFAITGTRNHLVHHAWITLDGAHVIDTTWPNAPECAYYGVEFPRSLVYEWAVRRGRYWELLDCAEPEQVQDLLERLALQQRSLA